MQCLTWGRKGKNHPPIIQGEMGGEKDVYLKLRETEMDRLDKEDGKVETDWQASGEGDGETNT